jgi:RHS repeat-associated protein
LGNSNSFLLALASAFGTSAGATGVDGKLYTGLEDFAGSVPLGDHPLDDDGIPKAFVTILLFDNNYNLLDATWDQITSIGAQTDLTVRQPPHDLLSATYKAKEAGFAYIFLSNEHPKFVDVYFDDVSVVHTPSQIVSASDYYPFGLTYNSYSRESSVQNNHLFNNSSELQTDLELGFYSTLFRTYDPAIGRFMQIDPLADFFSGITSYSFAFDNPILYNDPDGLAPLWWLQFRANVKQAWYNLTGRGNQHAIIHGHHGRTTAGDRKGVQIGATTAGQRPTPNPKTVEAATNYSQDDSNQESTIIPTPEPETTPEPVPSPIPTPNPIPDPIFKGRNIPENKKISFSENLSFHGNSDKMYETPQNDKIINDLVKTLKDYPHLKLFIVGNTGTAQRNPGESYGNGKDALNKPANLNGARTTVGGLMSARAKAIYDALIGKGIDATRLDYGPGTHYPSPKGRITSFVLQN